MFVQTLEDYLVQVSQIKTISPARKNRDGLWAHKLTLADDNTGRTFTITPKAANALTVSVIPATPGYELLVHLGGDEFARQPIIAWGVDIQSGNPAPVTPGDLEGLSQPQAILLPDGQVEIPYERTFENLDQWLKSIKNEHGGGQADAAAQVLEQRPHRTGGPC